MRRGSLVRGFGLELSEALSRYVLAGVMSRSEARRAEIAAATSTAANSNTATAGLVEELKRLRPHAIDVAGGQMESAGVVSRLEDGREVVFDLALEVEPETRGGADPDSSEAAE